MHVQVGAPRVPELGGDGLPPALRVAQEELHELGAPLPAPGQRVGPVHVRPDPQHRTSLCRTNGAARCETGVVPAISRRGSAFAAALLAVLGSLVLAPVAHAAERVVTLTDGGISPAVLTISPGDTVRFAVQSRPADRVRSTSNNWSFDSCPVALLGCPGSFTVPEALTAPGTYTYTATSGTKERRGSVVVAPPPAPAPAPPSSPADDAPKPAPSGAATQSPPGTGGTGSTALPPLPGGFGPAQLPGGPVPGGLAPAPTLALPLLPEAALGPLPATAPVPGLAPLTNLAVAGDLPGQPTMRRYGLPAALAAVLAAGVLSLLLRLLLSEPAPGPGRRRSPAGRVPAVD